VGISVSKASQKLNNPCIWPENSQIHWMVRVGDDVDFTTLIAVQVWSYSMIDSLHWAIDGAGTKETQHGFRGRTHDH